MARCDEREEGTRDEKKQIDHHDITLCKYVCVFVYASMCACRLFLIFSHLCFYLALMELFMEIMSINMA